MYVLPKVKQMIDLHLCNTTHPFSKKLVRFTADHAMIGYIILPKERDHNEAEVPEYQKLTFLSQIERFAFSES